MCGIFGIWHRNHQLIDHAELDKAGSTLCHRGPDDQGFLLANSATKHFALAAGADSQDGLQLSSLAQIDGEYDMAFGFRRLAILDLSLQGHQPMVSTDQRLVIVYNGEIYNYLELRQELITQGYKFNSTSDTEVLLAAYHAWGVDALTRLVGMFALALVDLEHNVLVLARDFFGIKPLYYTISENKFAFASEIPVLLNLASVSRKVNPIRLFDYLRFSKTDYGSETLFADVHQLPAGHYLEIPLDSAIHRGPQCYWKPTYHHTLDLSFDEAAACLREMFLESVQLHLRSDVPVGAALSGGIDSSAIVMAMRHLSGNTLDLHTFSYIANDPILSEEKWVDLIGTASGANVHKVRIAPDDLVEDIDHLITIQGEPFGSTSIYAQYRVFRLAQQAGIKVMLDGQGADELLGGYSIALASRFASLIRQGKIAKAFSFVRETQSAVGRLPGNRNLWLRSGHFLIPPTMRTVFLKLAGQDLIPEWLNESWFTARGVIPQPSHHVRTANILREELFESFRATSLPALLRYEDRNSMAHSIESRVPFLTPKLVNFIFSLPEEYLVSNQGKSKAVFRKAMRGLVPDSILDRKDKVGFVTPEAALLKNLKSWVEHALSTPVLNDIPVLRSAVIQRRWNEAVTQQGASESALWRWINLAKWSQHFSVDFVS